MVGKEGGGVTVWALQDNNISDSVLCVQVRVVSQYSKVRYHHLPFPAKRPRVAEEGLQRMPRQQAQG